MKGTANKIRIVAYLYLTALCIMWLFDNASGGHFNWFVFLLFALSAFALFLTNTVLDKVVGITMIIGSLYMILAVFSAYNRNIRQGHVNGAESILAVGLPLFLTALAFGFFIALHAFLRHTPNQSRMARLN
jgi:hypothetical protein